MTVAVAEEGRIGAREGGALYVVGTGPGDADYLTPAALKALRRSDVIVGYGPYIELLGGLIAGKEVETTGMSAEIDRCRRAIDLAAGGKTVSVVSGGDPGVYAMAGLIFQLLQRDGTLSGPPVEVIPGVSALNASSARLGAPLMHDFASISLSDRLTPWTTIEERLDAAARADFVIVLFNPRSKGRRGRLEKARDIMLAHRNPSTPVGIVKNAMRDGERVIVTDLGSIPFEEIDMRTTVVIGSSKTIVWNGRMITPRGYEAKAGW